MGLTVLFDIDDTLLDHASAASAGAIALHRRLESAMPVDAFTARWSSALEHHFVRYLSGEVTFQGQRRDRVREVVDRRLSDHDADGLFDEYQSAYEAAWSLFADALPCLERLSGHRLGVISNGQTLQQRQKLTDTGIADRFECIVVSEDCGYAKPAEEIFAYACRLMGVAPRDAVYVGDRYDVDADGARRAGLSGIWLDRRQTRTADHELPIINSLDAMDV